MFDEKLFILGMLCCHNHEYENTKQSLRYLKSNDCVICSKERSKIWIENNKEHKRALDKIWFEKNNLFKKYGITNEQKEQMLIDQNYQCLICHCDISGVLKDGRTIAHVDHDHQSNKVRGILCYTCNSKLGWLENNLQSALNYLNISYVKTVNKEIK